jgi:hypothetical protein
MECSDGAAVHTWDPLALLTQHLPCVIPWPTHIWPKLLLLLLLLCSAGRSSSRRCWCCCCVVLPLLLWAGGCKQQVAAMVQAKAEVSAQLLWGWAQRQPPALLAKAAR